MLNSAGLLAFLCWLCIATEYVQAAPYTATLSDFGARGDGISDDSDPIRDAFARIPAGAVLDGENKSYRVTGSFHFSRDLTVKNADFLQQAHAEHKVGTMRFGFHSECRDSQKLDEFAARGYTSAPSHIESCDCAEKSIQPKSLKPKTS